MKKNVFWISIVCLTIALVLAGCSNGERAVPSSGKPTDTSGGKPTDTSSGEIVPISLQGTWEWIGDLPPGVSISDANVIITANTFKWASEGPYKVLTVTSTHITVNVDKSYEEDIPLGEFKIQYELSGNILKILAGDGTWQERKKVK